MDNDLWSLRNKRSVLDTIENLINDDEYRLNLGLPSQYLWARRSEVLKEILEIQIRNYRR